LAARTGIRTASIARKPQALIWQPAPGHASKPAEWVLCAARLVSALPNSGEQNEQRLRSRCRITRHAPTRISPSRCSGESKLIVDAARIRPASAAAGPRCSGCTARARRGRARRPSSGSMSTNLPSSASPQSAEKTARGSPRRSQSAALALPAGRRGVESGTPDAVSKALAGTILTQAALDSMIAESWASALRRPPCPRRFVIIYRRGQAKVIAGRDAPWSQ
jgi:hypothetical protein